MQAAAEQHKAEREAHAAKHLQFIDKLLTDKRELAQQVEALTEQLARMSTATEARLRDVVERARSELLVAKDNWAVQEKVRGEVQRRVTMHCV